MAEPPRLPPAAAREDELMSLPWDTLDMILARIPFDQLVRTCCLSRAWRRRWESVRYLDIRLDWSSRGAPSAHDLRRCAAPVVGFRACVRSHHFHHLPTWFRVLASKGVRELAIECDVVRRSSNPHDPPYWDIDPGLFSCAALAVLHLQDCDMPLAPPGFRGFPSLVSLTLRCVTLPAEGGGAQVEHLVAAAPLLAELRLDDVEVEELYPTPPLYMWAVRAPHLRILKMVTRLDIGCRIPEVPPLLEEAYIDIGNGFMSFLDIFRQIITVKKLWFNIHEFDEYPLEGISWKFDNLRELHVTTNFGEEPSIMSLFSLLRCAPYIEDLSIEAEDISLSSENEPHEIAEDDFLSSGINDNSFSSLKHVSLSGITYSSNQLRFMKFLLSKTESLQSFAVTFLYSKSNKSYLKARRVLRAFGRASPQARFESLDLCGCRCANILEMFLLEAERMTVKLFRDEVSHNRW
uniref:F-box domain-containing protein n=1 Tax=Oryza punctata TaxID=4537 RepID=A0A0E0LT26_ORYPU